MPSPQSTTPPTPSHITLNDSYYSPDDDIEEDPGFSDLQTVALACFLTLLPLMFGLVSYFGFRVICKGGQSRKGHIRRPYVLYCWGRFRRSVEPSDISKTLDKESSHCNRSSQGLLHDQLKSSESQFSVVPADDIEDNSACFSGGSNLTSKATANGSIITMTMKNNHLIVETEPVISEEIVTTEQVENNELLAVEVASTADQAIVHQTPASIHEESRSPAGFNTGLSTSDLSCSSESVNRGYAYGTQSEYQTTDTFESESSQQFICHIVKPINTYGQLNTPIQTGLNSELRLELESPAQLRGEANPAYLPTPVSPVQQNELASGTTTSQSGENQSSVS